jgi:cytochrome b
VRLLHWTLAVSMIVSFATHEGGGRLHEWTGYCALAAAFIRCLLGLFGQGRWQFSDSLRGATVTISYLQSLVKGVSPRYIGHNPLGAWMMLALLVDAIAAGLTGWLYSLDRFWGLEWLGTLHNVLGHALLPLLALHVAGAIFTSVKQRENLIGAMVHGKKRAPSPTDIQ